jgi:hypothetical protein
LTKEKICFEKLQGFLAILFVVTVTTLFLSQFYNKFLPLGEGLFTVYGRLIDAGKLPYRDFYLFVPPLHVYFLKAFQGEFGFDYERLRLLGGGILVINAVLLQRIFHYFFDNKVSAIASLVSIFTYISHAPYILHDYNDFVNLFLLLAILLLLADFRRPMAIYSLSLGLVLALLFLEKQSTGLVILLLVLTIYGLVHGFKRKGIYLVTAGFTTILLIFLCYLISNNMYQYFINNIFINTGNKGGLIDILLRGLFPFHFYRDIIFSIIILIFYGMYFQEFKKNENLHIKIVGFCIIIAFIIFGLYNNKTEFIFNNGSFDLIINKFLKKIPPIFYISSFILTSYFITNAKLFNNKKYLLFLGPSTGITFCLIISAGNYVPLYSVYLSIGFFAGCAMQFRRGIYIFSCLLIGIYLLIVISFKLFVPYGISVSGDRWWSTAYQVPVYEAKYEMQAPLLRGIYTSEKLGSSVDSIVELLTKKNIQNNELLAYPLNSIFYVATNSFPTDLYFPTFWYDIANDRLMENDIKRLISNPPRYVVWSKYDENSELSAHECAYNKCKRFSSHRMLITFLNKRYKTIKSFKLEDDMNLLLLERR